MGQFSTCDFIGTRTRFQRFSDAKLFNGWIQSINVGSMVVRSSTDSVLTKGDRFMFHVASARVNARLVADFVSMEGFEMVESTSLELKDSTMASVVHVPEADFGFRVVSQLEYQTPTEEGRHMVDGWVAHVSGSLGTVSTAYLADVSENGAGILSPVPFQRGELLTLCIEFCDRNLMLQAEVRYSVRSKIAPGMFKAGLKFGDLGRLEGAVWRNLLRAA